MTHEEVHARTIETVAVAASPRIMREALVRFADMSPYVTPPHVSFVLSQLLRAARTSATGYATLRESMPILERMHPKVLQHLTPHFGSMLQDPHLRVIAGPTIRRLVEDKMLAFDTRPHDLVADTTLISAAGFVSFAGEFFKMPSIFASKSTFGRDEAVRLLYASDPSLDYLRRFLARAEQDRDPAVSESATQVLAAFKSRSVFTDAASRRTEVIRQNRTLVGLELSA